ncbi:MAG: DoxX family protein [Solirubrobacteraceae bacterium]|jgi:putative oxidoreductase
MSPFGLSASGRLAGIAPLVLRVVLGGVMLGHGYLKIAAGPARFGQQALVALGVPAPVLVGYVVTITEVAGGILLVVGLLSRVAAIALAIEMVFTTVLVKSNVGLISAPSGDPGAELDLALLAGFLAIALAGPGRLSLDRAVGLEKPRIVERPRLDLAAIGRSAGGLRGTGGPAAPERDLEPVPTGDQAPPTAVEAAPAGDTAPIGGPGPPVPQVEERRSEADAALSPVSTDPDLASPVPPGRSPDSARSQPGAAGRAAAGASTAQRLRERPGLTIAAGVAAGLLIRSALRRR